MTETRWHHELDDVNPVAAWLVDQIHLVTVEQLLAFYEKPWKWERERGLYLLYQSLLPEWKHGRYVETATGNADRRQACIDALDDDDMTAEMLREEFEREVTER